MLTLICGLVGLAIILAVARGLGARVFACVVIMLALGVRLDLFAAGSLYSSTDVWAADVITAVLVFVAMTVFLGHASTSSARVSWERRLTTAGVAIAVPVGLIGAVQLAAPNTPRTATAPACSGASVADGAFLATTPETGVNARSGPDTTYPQVQRFAANCTLSFDGYCIGEPVNDLRTTEYPDQRWLILHRPWETWPWDHMPWGDPPYAFVAAGTVQSQSAEGELGERPNKMCSHLGGWKPPTSVVLTTSIKQGVITISASSEGAEIIGVSVMSSQTLKDGSDSVFQLTEPAPDLTHGTGSITATWNAQAVTGPAVGRPATFTLLASVCLGPAVADLESYAIRQFDWNGKVITAGPSKMKSLLPTRSQRLHLQAAACRIAPGYKSRSAT
jgi:hypothetical protein